MKTADPELMRAINRLSVLDTVRRYGPISRVEISAKTQLSTTTVSAITASLLDDGLILPRHTGDIRTESARGRPRVMLELNPDAARVVGAKIAASRMTFVVTNFCGHILSTLTLPVSIDPQPIGVVADIIEEGVRRCVRDAGLSLEGVDMVCLGLPGVIEHRTGKIRSSPVLRDVNIDFASEMTKRLGAPTLIESDASAVTLGHHWFGKARDLDDMVLVSLEQTLGLGVLHQNALFRGAGGLSRNLGDLALFAGPDGITRLAAQAGESAIRGSPSDDRRFDHDLVRAEERAGSAIGLTLANLVTLFAPPRVLVVGSSLELGKAFIENISRTFAASLPPSLQGVAELVFETSRDELWAQGAAAVALHELYESPWNTTGPAF